jgi:hypothetical protein
MRLRAVAAALVFTVLSALPSAAALGPCEERLLLLNGGIDFPAVPPEESADVIVVFTPHVDIVTFSLDDRVVPGDLERVEKGTAPQTIVYRGNGFGASPQAGVRARFFLKAFPDGNAHYIIGKSPPEVLPPAIAVSVSAAGFGGPIRATRIGSLALIEAVVTPRPGSQLIADVYAGLRRPDGSSVWLSGTPLAPTLVESATPVPFLVGLSSKAAAIGATYRFADSDPPGWYTVFGAVVFTGSDPRDPCGWIHTSASPLFVTDQAPAFIILP